MAHYRAKKSVQFLHGLYDFCNACGGGLHENCKSPLLVFLPGKPWFLHMLKPLGKGH